jgi:hypothetical protein
MTNPPLFSSALDATQEISDGCPRIAVQPSGSNPSAGITAQQF